MEEEIAIFLESDDEEQTKQVYAYFGLAIYFAQVLEQHAINMIVIRKIFKQKLTSQTAINELWDNYEGSKKTFGGLVNEINQLYELSDDHKIKLNQFRDKRNFIAHDYFKFNVDIFYNEKGKIRMVQDFIGFREEAQEMDSILTNYFEKYKEILGLTKDRIDELMSELINKSKEIIVDKDYKSFTKERQI
ncbi:MAG: hypothetical protein JXQ90_24160 [Cyclobacteriaceae bacterium]